MMKTMTSIALFFAVAAVGANADIYRCQDTAGTVIFTDDPSNVPSDCQADVVRDLPQFVVSPSRKALPVQRDTSIQSSPRPTQAPSARERLKQVEKKYNSLKARAESLAGQDESVRGLLHRLAYSKNRRQARKELRDIQQRKSDLSNETDQSELTPSQKSEIREILATITE